MDARISTAFPQHPKTKKLAKRLGAEGPLACIYLILWVAANRSDGDLSGMTDEDIELAADWSGDEGALVAALKAVGFLDGDVGVRSMHDWAEHNPWAAGANDRSESSKWAALCKRYGRDGAAKRMPSYAERMRPASESRTDGVRPACDPHAAGTNPQCDSDAPSPSPLPIPSQEDGSPIGDLSPAAAAPPPADLLGDPDAAEVDPPGAPPCPVKRIVATYHEVLPMLARVRELPETAERMLRARWRGEAERQDVEWWRGFFEYVKKCPFLVGEKNDFQADLIWLVRPTNFAKVLNGNYEGRDAA